MVLDGCCKAHVGCSITETQIHFRTSKWYKNDLFYMALWSGSTIAGQIGIKTLKNDPFLTGFGPCTGAFGAKTHVKIPQKVSASVSNNGSNVKIA